MKKQYEKMKEMDRLTYHKLYIVLKECRQLASGFDVSNAFLSPPASMTRASTTTFLNEGSVDEDLVLI